MPRTLPRLEDLGAGVSVDASVNGKAAYMPQLFASELGEHGGEMKWGGGGENGHDRAAER